VACNRLNKIFIVNSSSKSCANLFSPVLLLLHFRSSFCAISVLDLFHRFEGVSLWISFRGTWVSTLCLFVDDLDSSNVGFGLRFVDFWMNPRSYCSWQRFVIPGVVGSFRL
jgi:hypothetical protein